MLFPGFRGIFSSVLALFCSDKINVFAHMLLMGFREITDLFLLLEAARHW